MREYVKLNVVSIVRPNRAEFSPALVGYCRTLTESDLKQLAAQQRDISKYCYIKGGEEEEKLHIANDRLYQPFETLLVRFWQKKIRKPLLYL